MELINRFIGVPLGYIMWLCYKVIGSYGAAIILFSVITKIILFPVSVKVQKNSVKMVKIKPKLDEIALRYAGDKERIYDEQDKVYKEEKYSPLIGLAPTFIQIPIILGLINVIYKPMQHLLHMTGNDIDMFMHRAAKLLQVERLGNSGQMKVIDLVKDPQYLGYFSGLQGVNGADELIRQIRSVNMDFCGMNLAGTPSLTHPNALLLIPLLAGGSALLLCILQNKSNVLQREQGILSQWGMTAFMVLFSVYFTMIVPAGVGVYWICSNLFSIVVMYILNMLYDPRKYIDYTAKAEMEKRLEKQKKFERNSKAVRKKNKTREKEDYKRFLHTENKELVFYSEKNGFYKYYRGLIRELLNSSDVVIHYITSDPEDSVFEMGEKRIIPYYIGETKLITLMMKMDADILVMTMPDLEQYQYKRSYVKKDIEYIYVFHYPLSTTMVLRKGALDYYDTVLCVGRFQFDEIRQTEKLYGLEKKNLVECGYGLLEDLYGAYIRMEKKERMHKKILLAPSWQEENILDSCVHQILEAILGKGYEIHIRPHPEYMKRFGDRMESIVEYYSDYEGDDLIFELDFTNSDSIFDSDMVITDWSGTAYEFAFVTKKPVVFINTPPKINNPEYDRIEAEPLELTLRREIGISVDMDNLDSLAGVLEELLNSGESYRDRITELMNRYISNFGHSAQAGAGYIIGRLKEYRDRKNGEEE